MDCFNLVACSVDRKQRTDITGLEAKYDFPGTFVLCHILHCQLSLPHSFFISQWTAIITSVNSTEINWCNRSLTLSGIIVQFNLC